MKCFIAAISAAFMLATTAAPVMAQNQGRVSLTGQDRADMQCILVYALLGDEGGAEVQTMAGMALFYYLGRLEGRTPSVDWLARLAAWMTELGDAKIASEAAAHADRCLGELAAKGEAMANFENLL